MLARSVTLNLLGQAGSLLVGFAASIALARWLGPSDRGLLAIMITVGELGLALAGIGLPFAVMYYASQREPRSGALLGNSLLYAVGLTAVFVPGFFLLRGPISHALSHGRGGGTWALAAGLVPLTFLDWTTHNQLLGKLRFGFYNVLVVLSKVGFLLGVVALVGVLGLGVAGGLVATAGGTLVLVVGSLAVVLRDDRPRLDRRLFRQLAGYGVRSQVGTVFQILNYRLDVVLVQFFRPLSSVGYYVVAQIIAELVITFSRAFQTSILPLVTHYEGETRQAEATTMSVRHHGMLAGAAVALNAVVGPLVIVFGFGPSFHPALVPMLILLPGMWFLGTGTVVTGVLRGRGRPGLASGLACVTVLWTVALDLTLIPRYGIPGAALASLGAYMNYGTFSLVILSRESGIPLRELAVPTRADFALYPRAVRAAFARVRPAARPA